MTPTRKLVNDITNVAYPRSQLCPTTRDDILKVINILTTERPHLFPTLGQNIPQSWLTCKNFLTTIRDIGCKDEDKEALFKTFE
eukprot:CAMPEP_0194078810 /NCGR_PEP_ID=MMETSP0149-20130528/5127_1 /TAXON_ID=122233 /ORGANISM="Chaetoceros debilis, Strain MM31A-1" /LENGTH=83 /DNA_ID=CAMNT_0038760141 /DNA_START=8 /DNA_END=256 /DNA_ORIENTATION=+